MDSFNFNTDDLLNQLVAINDNIGTSSDLPHNYCPECKTPMDIVALEYQCNSCGLVTLKIDDTSKEDLTTNHIHVSNSSRGRFYSPVTDYTKTQKKTIIAQFSKLKSEYSDSHRDKIAIPDRVINTVCEIYNNIQKKAMQRSDGKMILVDTSADIDAKDTKDIKDTNTKDTKDTKDKKFVRRSTIKDEILAALIYIQCQNEGVARKKKDIATFMKLSTQGFSRGEGILRDLKAQGIIDLAIDTEQGSSYITRYLTTLGIDLKYSDFINDIIEVSESNNVCMTSQTGSKVVGTIWVLIKVLGLKITAKELEAATDNTKKNTFDKFTKSIESKMGTFAPVFRKYELIK